MENQFYTYKEYMLKQVCYSSENMFEDWPNDYYVFPYFQNRDSDILTLDNFENISDELESIDDDIEIIRESHFLCGWIEFIIFPKDNEKLVSRAKELVDSLEDYPILDEESYSEREYEYFCENWSSWGKSDFFSYLSEELSDNELESIGKAINIPFDDIKGDFDLIRDNKLFNSILDNNAIQLMDDYYPDITFNQNSINHLIESLEGRS